MIITALNGATDDQVKEWVETYGVTHPVVADPGNQAYNLAGQGPGYWPYRILLAPGVVISEVDSGMSTSDIEPLLPGASVSM